MMTALLLLGKTQDNLSQSGLVPCQVQLSDHFWDSALIPPSTQSLSMDISQAHGGCQQGTDNAHQRGRGRLGQALAEVVVHEHVGGRRDGEQLQRRVGALRDLRADLVHVIKQVAQVAQLLLLRACTGHPQTEEERVISRGLAAAPCIMANSQREAGPRRKAGG